MRNATSEARELEAIAADSADFWPLSPITPDDALWAAWQLHRPHLGDGVVMYFRRSNATASSFATRWVGVSEGARYTLEYPVTVLTTSSTRWLARCYSGQAWR
jgi:hypothetical protein